MTATRTDLCPHCATAVTSARGAAPWCPACRWNLDAFEPGRRPYEFGWRWADRLSHRLAFRAAQRHHAALRRGSLERAGAPARVFLLAVSALLMLLVAATAGLGVWFVVRGFPGFGMLPGVVLLGAAWWLRPRFGALDGDVIELDPGRAPTLFALVERVSAAAGVRPPDLVVVDDGDAAYTVVVGWRRHRVLCLSVPFLVALPPQQRVALIGHEVAHFANGDGRRYLLSQLAWRTFGELADLMRPTDQHVGGLSGMIVAAFQWVLAALLTGVHLALVALGLRDGQRAEYLADRIAGRIAGTGAALALLDTLVRLPGIRTVVDREMRRGADPAAWRAAAAQALVDGAAATPVLRQLSLRDEASLLASHPPTGLRAEMLAAGPREAAAVTLTEAEAARIDDELRGPAGALRRNRDW